MTVFNNSTININLTANYDEANEQYYVINKLIVGDRTTKINKVSTTITRDVNELIEDENNIKPISITAEKVHMVENRNIESGFAINFVANDQNDKVSINGKYYIVENAMTYYNIIENNPEYEFLGMTINGELVLKSALSENDWSFDDETNTRTWFRAFGKDMATAEPVVLERWYTAENDKGRVVDVSVAEGVSAKLYNKTINYSYTLSNKVFDTGTDSLYAGTWQVVVDSYTINDYMLRVYVYSKGSDTPVEYGSAEFDVDANVERVEIVIRAIDISLNGVSANLKNVVSEEETVLNNDITVIENGEWQVIAGSLPADHSLQVVVYKNDGTSYDYKSQQFTIDSSVTKVEILIQPSI